jgi:hypothetical protein
MTLYTRDVVTLFGFDSNIKPWNHFEKMISDLQEPKDREHTDTEKKVIKM